MSIYFDVKTIKEILGDISRNEKESINEKEFTIEELSQYDGKNGKPAYVAIDGVVYDLSQKSVWNQGTHFGLTAGKDLTDQFQSCHGTNKIIDNLPRVGVLVSDKNMNVISMDKGIMADKSNFTPDDWVRYIAPLVDRALAEAKQGINPKHLYEEFILSGVLVGLGKNPQEAIDQVEEWEKNGTSQLLAKSKINRLYWD